MLRTGRYAGSTASYPSREHTSQGLWQGAAQPLHPPLCTPATAFMRQPPSQSARCGREKPTKKPTMNTSSRLQTPRGVPEARASVTSRDMNG